MASPSTKIFSIPLTKDSHGNPVGHTFNTKEDIEPYLKQLRDVKDSVEEICLSGHTFGLDACEAVGEVLVEIPNLKIADFSDIFTGRLKSEIPKSLTALCTPLIPKASLLEINLSDNAIGESTDKIAPLLIKNRSFQILRIRNNGLDPTGGRMLADALVKSLEIDPNDDAKKTPRAPFRVLDCRRNRLENGSAQAWAKVFSEHKSLVEVTMAHNSIRREGLEMIVRGLIPNPQLEYLDLENNTFFEMGDEAKNKPSKNVFPDIAEAVKSWPSLRTLNLSDCFLRTSGGEALFTQLSKGSNPKLEVLNICDNRINIGLRILATALYKGRLPALTSFEFGGNKANSLNRHSLKRIHDKVNEQRAKKGLPRIQKVEKGEDTNDDDEDEDDDLDDDTEAEEHQRKEDEEWEADEVEEEKEEPTAKKGYVDAETDRLADLLAKSGLSSS